MWPFGRKRETIDVEDLVWAVAEKSLRNDPDKWRKLDARTIYNEAADFGIYIGCEASGLTGGPGKDHSSPMFTNDLRRVPSGRWQKRLWMACGPVLSAEQTRIMADWADETLAKFEAAADNS